METVTPHFCPLRADWALGMRHAFQEDKLGVFWLVLKHQLVAPHYSRRVWHRLRAAGLGAEAHSAVELAIRHAAHQRRVRQQALRPEVGDAQHHWKHWVKGTREVRQHWVGKVTSRNRNRHSPQIRLSCTIHYLLRASVRGKRAGDMRPVSLAAVLLHVLLPTHLRSVQSTNAGPQCSLPPATAPDTSTANCTPSVSVNTSILGTNGEWVKVSWAACSGPSVSDFVALLPADASITATSPLKLVPTYGAASGSFDFYLFTLRTACTFRLYRGGLVGQPQPQLLAISQPVTWQYPNEPTGVHLALTGTATEMRVTWTTAVERAPAVWYAPSDAPASSSVMARATSSRLERSDMYGDAQVSWQPSRPLELSSNATKLGFIDLGTQHSAVMGGLVPGVTYTYVLGSCSDTSTGRNFTASFTQPPGRGDAQGVTFLVAADMGATDVDGANWDDVGCVASRTELSMRGWDNRPAANTTAQMLACVTTGCTAAPGLARPQAVFVNGDVSYARGYGAIWQAFLNQMTPTASAVPLMTCPGNHESDWPHVGTAWNTSSLDSGGEGGVAYSHLFPMPAPSTSAAPWYSFDIGRVHIAVLSTEADVSAGSEQVEWLAADLAAAAAADWKIVMAHRFFYIDSSTPDADAAAGAALRAALEPVMAQHGVALTFTGHHHSYQRTKPLLGGIVHVVAGHAGAGLSGLCTGRPDIAALFDTPPELVQDHGFLHVTFNATHAVITAIRSSDGLVVDQFAVEKRG